MHWLLITFAVLYIALEMYLKGMKFNSKGYDEAGKKLFDNEEHRQGIRNLRNARKAMRKYGKNLRIERMLSGEEIEEEEEYDED